MKAWLGTTRAGAHAGPQSECDACFENAWTEEACAYPYADTDTLDARADQARADGHHPCSDHK